MDIGHEVRESTSFLGDLVRPLSFFFYFSLSLFLSIAPRRLSVFFGWEIEREAVKKTDFFFIFFFRIKTLDGQEACSTRPTRD